MSTLPYPGRRKLDIMDTTLRDGEQTQGVSYPGNEKLILAQALLGRVGVDRIEVASCRVSKGELKSLASIMEWAESQGFGDRVEVLSFTDTNKSADWMREAGCRRMNLLTKGSLNHLTKQLRKTPQQHRDDIRATLDYSRGVGISVSIYLEDWSNGMLHSRDYVYEMLDAYAQWPFERILLPDTLGVLNPSQVHEMIADLRTRYPETLFEFHAHNDYGFATANTLMAAQLGVAGVHCTVNGLGERAGNASLDELVAAMRDHSDREVGVDETELQAISELVQVYSGKRVADNKPIAGRSVFTQTAGIHADGDKKGDLYASRLSPERFGRDRQYALGKLSGRSNLEFNLNTLNLDLTPDQRQKVLDRVIELGDKKHNVTAEDLPFIIADVLQSPQDKAFQVISCAITSALNTLPVATVRVAYKGKEYKAGGTGSGGFDAFMKALRSLEADMGLELPRLADYEVHIPPGGRTDAIVETTITWENGLRTRAVNSDQVMAAIEATERAVNLIELGLVPEKTKRSRLLIDGELDGESSDALSRDAVKTETAG
ncbi:MAG: alpha-isopropylmalate synthase regulatory domain-containing protein [Sumerlaeia bacterium]